MTTDKVKKEGFGKERSFTPEKRQECEALYQAIVDFNESRPKEERISQNQAAARAGITQSGISQYITGKIPLNVNAAVIVLKAYGIPVESYSPRLAAELKEIATLYMASQGQRSDLPVSLSPQFLYSWEKLSSSLKSLPNVAVSQMSMALGDIEAEHRRMGEHIALLKTMGDSV